MASAKIKNYRWIIVGLLFTGTVINYLDRQIIGLLKPTLEAEFSWTESDFGKIMSAFSFAYAIGLLVSGRFIDKVGTKIGYSVAVVVWSLAGMFHALAKSVMGFGIARLSLGIGEAGNFPAAMKALYLIALFLVTGSPRANAVAPVTCLASFATFTSAGACDAGRPSGPCSDPPGGHDVWPACAQRHRHGWPMQRPSRAPPCAVPPLPAWRQDHLRRHG